MERWKPINNYEGLYEVSSLGRVRSIPRVVRHSLGKILTIPGRIRKTPPGTNGYPVVSLSKNGVVRAFFVHHLVFRAFRGEPPEGMHIRHRDGNSSDCRLSNLRIGTPKQNAADRKLHGTHHIGCAVHNSKLTPSQVRKCRKLYGTVTNKELGDLFGISRSQASMAGQGKTYKDVK